ncbi:hypothetical protein D2T29_20900 [Sinirhodobacter populi]|uniref:Uncharacterized protein n=1 Tax=Paenirhodobacter populi TaxID=2306993 RepID=A0A443K0Q3_9RHOB|nr:hypothetical protein [Sinirhodobacter populi]RWR26295.1 hypothetical protein D2T29_20900 [Sinirhodobacter populi]
MKRAIFNACDEWWRGFLSAYGETLGAALTLVSFFMAFFVGALNFMVRRSMADVVANPGLGEFNKVVMEYAGTVGMAAAVVGFIGHWLRRKGIDEANKAIIEDLRSARQIDKIISDYSHEKLLRALIEAFRRSPRA